MYYDSNTDEPSSNNIFQRIRNYFKNLKDQLDRENDILNNRPELPPLPPLDLDNLPKGTQLPPGFPFDPDNMDIERGEDENGTWETKTGMLPGGNGMFIQFSRSSSGPPPEGDDNNNDLPPELAQLFGLMGAGGPGGNIGFQQESMDELTILKTELKEAETAEDYERAAKIRDEITKVKATKKEEKDKLNPDNE